MFWVIWILKFYFTKRDTSGGIFGRTLSEWTRRHSSKKDKTERRDLIFSKTNGKYEFSHVNQAALWNNLGLGGSQAQAGQNAHPAVVALMEKEKENQENERYGIKFIYKL